ncbi:MAG TPA: hypothetical protein VGJ33_05970 [Candidatus Angelobacter sp.]|jgi:hypothetical protein
MDKKQLVTIAVTAAVSVVAKEIFTWVVARAKSQAAANVIKQTASRAFTHNVRMAIWYTSWIVWGSFLLWRILRMAGPPTRIDVVVIVTDMAVVVWWSSRLIQHFALLYFRRKASRELIESTAQAVE